MGVDKGVLNALMEHKKKVQSPHFIFSCNNPKFPENNELKLSHEQILSTLQSAGYDACEINSLFDVPEVAIIVYDIDENQASQLHGVASRLGQGSSIHSDGYKHSMVFHHGPDFGKMIQGQGINWYQEKPENSYVSLPGETDHFSYVWDMNKSENSKKDVGEIYKDGARKHCDVLFKVKIKGQNKLQEEIPLHMSVKLFNDIEECDIDELEAAVKEFNVKAPDTKRVSFEPIIFHSSQHDTDYYMLELKNADDSYEKLYNKFKDIGKKYKKFFLHITINKEIYDEVKKNGLKPEDVEFGPLTLEKGANNTVHVFKGTK